MLQVQYIKDHKEAVLAGLEKRGVQDFENAVATVLQLDEDRKSTQTKLDATLSESNKLSKEIGMLFKSGEP
ncbi:MAG: serine--tRNA ligase, partial [Flavicella sp.]